MDLGPLRRLRARVDSMVARAVISRVNDALKTQRLQLTILADETVDDVEHFQPYGMSFVPPAGSEAVAVAVGGARSHTIAICAQHPDHRPKGGAEGTGGLYTAGEWRVFIDAAGMVHIGAQTGAEAIARADRVESQLTTLKNAITNATPGSADGGAQLQSQILASLSAWPGSVGADKGKVT